MSCDFDLEFNNVQSGALHILMRHSKQLQQLVPAIGHHINSLPEDLKSRIESYSRCRTRKSKYAAMNHITNVMFKYKRNQALKKAQLALQSYLKPLMSTGISTTIDAKNGCQLVQLAVSPKLELNVLVTDYNYSQSNGQKWMPVRSIITAYVTKC
uniref:Transposase n=1 Tax=Panagrellus redivivus TaxID=6233 RepID=A0A7E4VM40_PANRE